MTKPKSLVDGIGNQNVTKKYYDDWATNYDITLKKWKYNNGDFSLCGVQQQLQ